MGYVGTNITRRPVPFKMDLVGKTPEEREAAYRRDDPDPDMCMWPSRVDWPIYHYDGRWRCSRPLGHDGEHTAYHYHDLDGEVCWEGPWVPEADLVAGSEWRRETYE